MITERFWNGFYIMDLNVVAYYMRYRCANWYFFSKANRITLAKVRQVLISYFFVMFDLEFYRPVRLLSALLYGVCNIQNVFFMHSNDIIHHVFRVV